jgi:hypothetical protein
MTILNISSKQKGTTLPLCNPPFPHLEDNMLVAEYAAEYVGLRPQVPQDYYDYLDIFSQCKGTILLLRCLRDVNSKHLIWA